jgi:DNA-binding CsgD family transcriptional regulator
MDSERIARLTEQQRICLRHVYAHMTSKEIAPLLGIEPNSVDQHIKMAMRVLGVGDRRAAARMLAEYEEMPQPVAMREEQAAFGALPDREPVLPLPLEGLRPTRVGWRKRLVWIAAIAVASALAFAALIAAADSFERLMRL